MEKPVISFEKYEIVTIEYKKLDDTEVKEKKTKTSVSIGYTEDLLAGKVEINVHVQDPEIARVITLEVRGLFTLKEDFTEEQIKMYLSQNGTAMLYPYVRSFMSIISTLDSQGAIVLPTINTTSTPENN